MTLFFIEARTDCQCCQTHYRGPYQGLKDAELRLAYLNKNGLVGFHNGVFSIIEKTVKKSITIFDTTIWVIDGYWLYETDSVPVQADGSIQYPLILENFCPAFK